MCQCNQTKTKGFDRRGKILITHQDLSIHNPELFNELFRPDLYHKKIRKTCIYCENKIPGTWLYYWSNGNSCRDCSVRHNENIKR